MESLKERPERKGTWTWKDGRTYVGDFKNGMKEGEGVMNFPDGRTYTGGFR